MQVALNIGSKGKQVKGMWTIGLLDNLPGQWGQFAIGISEKTGWGISRVIR